MIDVDTFLTTLYIMADDFCQSRCLTAKHTPGPMASLQGSEVITLALFYQVDLVTPAHQSSKRIHWPKALRCWVASLREIIETVNDKLLNTFRLARERPHDLTGFQARLAAKVGLHNVCLWLNLHLGRAPLAFADLMAW